MLNFDVKLSKKDYIKYRYFNSFVRRSAFIILSIILIMVITLNLIVYYPKIYNPAVIFCCLGLIIVWLILIIRLNISANNYMKTDRISIGKVQNILIDDNGIVISTEISSYKMEYSWDKVFVAYETKNYIYAYVNLDSAIIIPKNVLSIGNLNILRIILKQKVGKNFKTKAIINDIQDVSQVELNSEIVKSQSGLKNFSKILIFIVLTAVYILICIQLRSVLNNPTYSNDLKATLEYNGDEYNADKNLKKELGNNLSYDVGTNKYGYVVFKDPAAAFEQIKIDCVDAFNYIKNHDGLDDVANKSIKKYAESVEKITAKSSDSKIYKQANKIKVFWNIYQQSFDQMYR